MSIPECILNGINRLEPLPATVQKLILIIDQSDVNVNEVAQIIEYDSAVAANILHAANSLAYGGRFPIVRLRDAVVRLGTGNLLTIALGDHFKRLKVAAPLYDLTEDELWLHGAAASLAVKAMISEVGRGIIPEVSAIAALVHDIGKLIISRDFGADVSRLVTFCRERDLIWIEGERELFGFDHAEVGYAMAQKWKFPDAITRIIHEHHDSKLQDPIPMLDAVILANLAAKSIGVGLGAAGMNMHIDYAGCRERIGLTIEGFERVCAQTAFWLQDFHRDLATRQ